VFLQKHYPIADGTATTLSRVVCDVCRTVVDSHLDVCHEKALILMRQLYFVEGALLNGDVFGESTTPRATHLRGVLASEAEMIVADLM
jgi:hypothetical protein